ncbi:biotin--[acetyl-CoA-carboxylase] ligase [Oleisolibacter albus]|uniref:biotin--[acetyl-CoA-carboxylase] ligase n=1 Tax=Oleisolibacter albus TaxID=2171757 RepID=UPI001EFEE398|nr:biotin--[acetyl-CoA-carboxylase] ligase [Oleisolibacter albus]
MMEETRAGGLPAFFRLVSLDSCGSTNDEAKELARSGALEGTLVWALRQTGGRGRRGRVWTSPPGNLYCSLILRPDMPAAAAALVSFVAAIAVAEAVSALIPGRPQLKWPNDVLVDGAKISGILLESEAGAAGRLDWLVLGVGINVAHRPEGLPYAATSLAAAGAAELDVAVVLGRYASSFAAWYARFRQQGFAPVRAAWRNAAFGLGGPITVRLQDGQFEGRFIDLDAEGGLLVETGDGLRRVTAGDVFFA